MERETRFELATLALARRCSTTELLPLSKRIAFLKVVERNVPLFLPLCPEALFPPLVDLNGPNKPATPLREVQRGIADKRLILALEFLMRPAPLRQLRGLIW